MYCQRISTFSGYIYIIGLPPGPKKAYNLCERIRLRIDSDHKTVKSLVFPPIFVLRGENDDKFY